MKNRKHKPVEVLKAFVGDVIEGFLVLSVPGTLESGLNILVGSIGGAKFGKDLSVKELLSVDDVSGVIGVSSGGGLLLGEGLPRVPCATCAAHFASNLVLDFEPGGLPTAKEKNMIVGGYRECLTKCVITSVTFLLLKIESQSNGPSSVNKCITLIINCKNKWISISFCFYEKSYKVDKIKNLP